MCTFSSVQNLAYFFTLNISTKDFSTSKGGRGARPPKYVRDHHDQVYAIVGQRVAILLYYRDARAG